MLESTIRAAFPLGTVNATNVYPTGTIFQPCYWDGTTFTNGPTPRWVPQTQIARMKVAGEAGGPAHPAMAR